MQQPRSAGLGEAVRPLASPLQQSIPGSYGEIEARFERLSLALDAARSDRQCELAEKELLADRLQSLLNALPAAVLVLDGQGRVQEQNPAAEALLGQHLQGHVWRELIDKLFLPQAVAGSDLLLHNGRYVSLSTCPLGHEPGQILLLHDVTEKRQIQHHLEHNRRLADMGRMAASLAHQIRTPLATALLYVSQLASLSSGNEMQQRFSRKALESLKGLEKLIADMLLFANGGGQTHEPVQAADVLQQAVEPLRLRLEEQDIELVMALDKGECTLSATPRLLISALQNLINNAIAAMPDGGRLTLSLHSDSGRVEIGVRDTGSGIDPSVAARLFEPFVTTRQGGTGLGLAVVQAVARTMGGEVQCESKAGEGSCFTLRLPLGHVAPPELRGTR